MARIEGVSKSQAGPVVKLVYRFGPRMMKKLTGRDPQTGNGIEPIQIWAHQPKMMMGMGRFNQAVRKGKAVDERIKNLVELKGAQMIGCEFCVDLGSQICRNSGFSDDELLAMPRYQSSDLFTDREKAALDFKKRMETIDDDIAARAAEFLEKQVKADKPVFLCVNFTHMHFRTHPKPESVGQSGRWMGPYADVMIDHDKNVGTVLDKIKELGIDDNTIVMYSTDNGPHMNSWPDAAMTPFRNEKNTNWEGAYRVPAMVRWPGKIKPGSVSNEIVSHLDWMPTLLAAAGVPDITEKLLKGYKAGKTTFKVHLDGYNLVPYLTGQEAKSPRKEFFYFSDEGDLTALRFDNWKLIFASCPERRRDGAQGVP